MLGEFTCGDNRSLNLPILTLHILLMSTPNLNLNKKKNDKRILQLEHLILSIVIIIAIACDLIKYKIMKDYIKT